MKEKFTRLFIGVALAVATGTFASAATAYDFSTLSGAINTSLSGFACTGTGCPSATVSAQAFWFSSSSAAASGASLNIYHPYGLSICDTSDPGYSGGDCSYGEHQIDNHNGFDALLITFSTAVNLNTLNLTAFNGVNGQSVADADLTYWVNKSITTGTTTLTTLGSGSNVTNSGLGACGSGCSVSDSVNLTNVTSIIIAASTSNPDTTFDGFKVTSLAVSAASATPEPTSMAMLGSGLVGCGLLLRRRKKN